jgi:hypothetical protein
MAQTKRKRQTKHRGNAAGKVEVRGRTGRKPTESERKTAGGAAARKTRPNRFDSPPTWQGAAKRAGIATIIFMAAVIVATRRVIPTLALAVFMLAIYVPMGYYTDQWAYRRRQRKLADGTLKR